MTAWRHYWPGLAVLLVTGLVGASPLERQDGEQDQPGATLFAKHCAACHTGRIPRAPGLEMMGYMAPESLYRVLQEGVMQDMAEGLSSTEKQQIAEFVAGRPMAEGDTQAALTFCESGDVDLEDRDLSSTPGWGVTPGNTRAYTDAQTALSRENLGRLELKWAFGFPGAVRARSQPLVTDEHVFVGSQDGTVYALDKEMACVRWRFQARGEVRTGILMTAPNDDAENAMLLFGDYLGYVYAIDARTGDLVWRDKADDHPGATITGTPAIHGDWLYVPVTSLEVASAARPEYPCCTFRGTLVAYDLQTGERRWKTYSIPDEPRRVGENDRGVPRFAPSGAGIWNTPTIDPDRGMLYVGTGQNYSSPTSPTSDSVLALDLLSGEVQWVFQARRDAWNTACEMEDKTNCPAEAGDNSDMDFGAAVILAKGKDGREYLLAGQKSGHVWALNPEDGSVVWQRKVGRGGMLGGVHFGMAAVAGTLVVPINDENVRLSESASGTRYTGKRRPGIHALDIATGEPRWYWPAESVCGDHPGCKRGYSAPATLTDELVITGSLDGRIRIHDLRNGEVLWRHNTVRDYTTPSGGVASGGAMAGGSGAVLHGDMMLMNSGYMLMHHMPGNVLLAFELVENGE